MLRRYRRFIFLVASMHLMGVLFFVLYDKAMETPLLPEDKAYAALVIATSVVQSLQEARPSDNKWTAFDTSLPNITKNIPHGLLSIDDGYIQQPYGRIFVEPLSSSNGFSVRLENVTPVACELFSSSLSAWQDHKARRLISNCHETGDVVLISR